VLAQPRFGEFDRVEHLVVVLDNSASMQATVTGQPSFRDQVIADLGTRAAELGRNSRFTLILSGRRPVMLAGPAVEWSDARERLAAWRPSAAQHDFQSAWDLASQFAGDSGRLLFCTDRLPAEDEPTPAGMEVAAVGLQSENVAITDARWTFDSLANVGRVFVRLSNLGRQPTECEISGQSAGQTVFERTVSLPAGGDSPFEAEVPGGLRLLVVQLQAPGDALALDNSVTLIEPSVRMLTTAVTLPADDLAHAAIERALKTLADVQLGDAASAHLVFAPAETLP
jgi:hypothetical protein